MAVKVLQMTCRSHSSRELESFKREVEVLSTLQHPHIVRFLGACTVPPNICIIEELAAGGSLHTRLHGKPGSRRRQPLPYGELLGIAAGIADAMVYLHPKVVHRDLKSQAREGRGAVARKEWRSGVGSAFKGRPGAAGSRSLGAGKARARQAPSALLRCRWTRDRPLMRHACLAIRAARRALDIPTTQAPSTPRAERAPGRGRPGPGV